MKYGKTTWKCSCGETVTHDNSSWLIINELLFKLKVHKHCRSKHLKRYYSNLGLLKAYIELILFGVVNVFTIIFWALTYPFWALHEFLG